MLPLSENTAPWLLHGNKAKPKKKTSNKVGVLLDFHKQVASNPIMKPLENMCFKFKASRKENPEPAQKTAQIAIQTTITPVNPRREQTILTDKSNSKPPSPARSQGQILETDHTSDVNSLAGDSHVSRRINTKYSKANLKVMPRPSSALEERSEKSDRLTKKPPTDLKQLFLDDSGLNIVSNTVLAARNNNAHEALPKKDQTQITRKHPIFQKRQGSSRPSSYCKQNVSNVIYSKYSPNVAPIQIKRHGKVQTTLQIPLHMVRSIHSQQIRDNINFWQQSSIPNNPGRTRNFDQFVTEKEAVRTKDCFSQMFNEFCK